MRGALAAVSPRCARAEARWRRMFFFIHAFLTSARQEVRVPVQPATLKACRRCALRMPPGTRLLGCSCNLSEQKCPTAVAKQTLAALALRRRDMRNAGRAEKKHARGQ